MQIADFFHGRSLDVADTTVKRYLDVLAGTFMVRRLVPCSENIGKRQVKTPKIYFHDSGLLHRLAGVHDAGQLPTWTRLGASWETHPADAPEGPVESPSLSPEQ